MSETFGLFPNTLVSFDDKRLCLSLMGSATHQLLYVQEGQYSIKGNTITFLNECNLSDDEIKALCNSGLAYKLMRIPEVNPETHRHSYSIRTEADLSSELQNLFTLTLILDKISDLPCLHYPFLANTNRLQISDTTLEKGCIRKILSKMRGIKRIRLLSTDILNSNILFLPEFEGRNLETIINLDYYLAHVDELHTLKRNIHFIVYLEDVSRFDEIKSTSSLLDAKVSFFCKINQLEDLGELEKRNICSTPFPAPDASEKLLHTMLDYPIEDLLQSTISRRDLLLKYNINPLFYGNIIVDNSGRIHSFPLFEKDYEYYEFGETFKQLKNNPFWHLKRSDFFEKCRKCALLGLCPPLSHYEINLRQTFCKE